jgi:hypothetical protein
MLSALLKRLLKVSIGCFKNINLSSNRGRPSGSVPSAGALMLAPSAITNPSIPILCHGHVGRQRTEKRQTGSASEVKTTCRGHIPARGETFPPGDVLTVCESGPLANAQEWHPMTSEAKLSALTAVAAVVLFMLIMLWLRAIATA